jgi:flagellar motor switch protein FliM
MKEKIVELVPGSSYLIYSIGPDKEAMETRGTFVGYAYISKDESGVCIKMDSSHGSKEGMIRIIPTSMILAIDILKEKRVRKKEEEPSHYFS